jgi:hypothetical protein
MAPRTYRWLLLLTAMLFTTMISAFHSFQTIAPSHGTAAHEIWEGTLRGSGIILTSYNTMAGRLSVHLPASFAHLSICLPASLLTLAPVCPSLWLAVLLLND